MSTVGERIPIAENFNRLSRMHERYRQADDRQTDRQTGDDSSRWLKIDIDANNTIRFDISISKRYTVKLLINVPAFIRQETHQEMR